MRQADCGKVHNRNLRPSLLPADHPARRYALFGRRFAVSSRATILLRRATHVSHSLDWGQVSYPWSHNHIQLHNLYYWTTLDGLGK
jgi:hypothetical protein